MFPDATYLESYNCDPEPLPKPEWSFRAKKQIFRTDYVLYHYVHYSTITKGMATKYEDWLLEQQQQKQRRQEQLLLLQQQHKRRLSASSSSNNKKHKKHNNNVEQSQWRRIYGEYPPSERETDAATEALMIHSKSSTYQTTASYGTRCATVAMLKKFSPCFVGFPWPMTRREGGSTTQEMKGTSSSSKTDDDMYSRLLSGIEIPYYDGGYNETLLLEIHKSGKNDTEKMKLNTENVPLYNIDGYKHNCYVNPKVEYYWLPKLKRRRTKRGDIRSSVKVIAVALRLIGARSS